MIRTKEDIQNKVYEIMADVTEINQVLSELETLSPIPSANIYNNLCPISRDIKTVKNVIRFISQGNIN